MKKFMKIKSVLSLVTLIYFISCSLSNAKTFQIKSNDIKFGEVISQKHVFNGFGCDGKNISPQISWNKLPKGTKSLALSVYDPDAPTGSGWWHWILVNIPVDYTEIPKNFGAKNNFELDGKILQIRNDFGQFAFGGPCPPKGDKKHRYVFTIHALKTSNLNLKDSDTAALAGFMINANEIAKASFIGFYKR
jgi:hypothetical protein